MACDCGRREPFERCCGPILAGKPAPTAEALMRSRYSAHVRGDIDHLMATWHPSTRKDTEREQVARWARESEWLGLTILDTEAGGPDDDEGVVEFEARYRAGGSTLVHHERSRFRRREGRWQYVDGRHVAPASVTRAPSAGRNDPCPCGSGRKFKKCCGA